MIFLQFLNRICPEKGSLYSDHMIFIFRENSVKITPLQTVDEEVCLISVSDKAKALAILFFLYWQGPYPLQDPVKYFFHLPL